MEVAPLAIGAPQQVIDSVRALIDAARDLSSWRKLATTNPLRCEQKLKQIRLVSDQLEHLATWSDGAHAYTPIQVFLLSRTRLKLNYIQEEVSHLTGCLKSIQTELSSKHVKMFPLLTDKELSELDEKAESVRNVIDDLQSDIEKFITETADHRNDGSADMFKLITGMVPRNAPGMYFELGSPQDSNTPRTAACKLKITLCSSASDDNVTVIVFGPGGTGKSCALRHVGRDKDVKAKFWGGQLYFELGENAGESELKQHLAGLVERAGGEKQAEKVRKADTLREVWT